MPSKLSFRIRAVFVLCAVLAVLLFNRGGRPERSPQQDEYDAWFASIEQRLLESGGADPHLPPISISVSRAVGGDARRWSVALENSPESRDRILRLLSLAREGNLFSLAKNNPGAANNELIVGIESGNKNYSADITPAAAHSDVRISLLIKLLEEFAAHPLNQPGIDAATLASGGST